MHPTVLVTAAILILFGAAAFCTAASISMGSDEKHNAHDLSLSGTPADNYSRTIEKWLEEGAAIWKQTGDISSLIAHYAERQLGIDYVGGLLDGPGEETLVVTLSGSDCVIYVEMSLAMALTTMRHQDTYEAFRDNLTLIRYREGIMDGYASRLHYFSDWLVTNQEKGIVTLLFQEEEAEALQLPVIRPPVFMSENRGSYRHLADDDRMFRKIRQMERKLEGMRLHYIPEGRIPGLEHRLQTGDVLAFVTSIGGLDISHTALVLMTENGAGFYHASLTGSVILDPRSIYGYVKERKNVKGIIVARVRPPDASKPGPPNE